MGQSRVHLLREQVEPLLLSDGLLSEQLENDGSHQIPLVLKLQGPLVLEEKYEIGRVGGRLKNRNERGGVGREKAEEDKQKFRETKRHI